MDKLSFADPSYPHFWQIFFFDNIALMKYGLNTKINLREKDIPSCWEDYKITLQASFCKEKLLRATSGKILFQIITIPGIKRSQKKNKYYKWKTLWVKRIIATKSILY